jgi:hypothetical protein
VILATVWLKEKGEGPLSSFVLTAIPYRISLDMTKTDKSNTEIDSRSLVSFCCWNIVVFCLCLPNHGKLRQKFHRLVEKPRLFGAILMERKTRPFRVSKRVSPIGGPRGYATLTGGDGCAGVSMSQELVVACLKTCRTKLW